MTHNNLNFARLADKPYLRYLKAMKKSGILNNTMLIFLGDHGVRYGPIRQTYIGALEERLPTLFIALPEWFRAKYVNINIYIQKQ